jgi:ethanolamine-phosphate cytidylyltransferase
MKPDSAGDSLTTEIRIFMDGAFDLMHYGHMNAFRLGRSLGTYLIVGVNSDSSITECKGPPLMNDQERLTMVKSCKFVDEVIPDCPYIMDADYVNWVIATYKIDYVVHGDDPCIVDGKDVYAAAKDAGKFRSIPRTHGVSTTDIIGRMLLLAQNPHFNKLEVDKDSTAEYNTSLLSSTLLCHRSVFLTTSRIIRLFHDHNYSDRDAPTQKRHTVYIDGSWDLFNPGHIAILAAAKKV